MERKLKLPLVGQPDPDVPKDVHLVGRYALGVDWADSHGSIYPFERLRRMCPCGACAELPDGASSAWWPREIKRTAEGLLIVWSDAHESVYPYPDLRTACGCAACTGGH